MSTASAGPAAAPPKTGGGCWAVLGGLALTGFLHVLASLAVIVGGSLWSPHGEMIVFVFWIFLGAAQWVYMLPAALLARRLGWRGLAKGLWIGGALGVGLSLLILAANVAGPLKERITGDTPANTVYSGSESEVVEADATHVTVRLSTGRNESYDLTPGTGFGYLGKAWQQQKSPAGAARLVPGARVSVDWVLRGGRKQAKRVTIWVETSDG